MWLPLQDVVYGRAALGNHRRRPPPPPPARPSQRLERRGFRDLLELRRWCRRGHLLLTSTCWKRLHDVHLRKPHLSWWWLDSLARRGKEGLLKSLLLWRRTMGRRRATPAVCQLRSGRNCAEAAPQKSYRRTMDSLPVVGCGADHADHRLHLAAANDEVVAVAVAGDDDDKREVSSSMRQRALALCAKMLGGGWRTVAPMDAKVLQIRTGMSNLLFLCCLPDGCRQDGVPGEVLLRFYIDSTQDVLPYDNYQIIQNVIFVLLSERHLGPKLLGVFPEGRCEEYLQARPLTYLEIRHPDISRMIARKLAGIHQLWMPISKESSCMLDYFNHWAMKLNALFRYMTNVNIETPAGTIEVDEAVLQKEMKFIRNFMKKMKRDMVFCHNDLQEGNIMVGQHMSDVMFIDFEYAGYNFRAFDIANHFCEWSIAYGGEKWPYFTVCGDDFPSSQEQRHFCHAYLEALADSAVPTADQPVDTLCREVACFVPVSHFFWAVWSLLHSETSKIEFGYMEYAKARFSLYFSTRSRLLQTLSGDEQIVKTY